MKQTKTRTTAFLGGSAVATAFATVGLPSTPAQAWDTTNTPLIETFNCAGIGPRQWGLRVNDVISQPLVVEDHNCRAGLSPVNAQMRIKVKYSRGGSVGYKAKTSEPIDSQLAVQLPAGTKVAMVCYAIAESGTAGWNIRQTTASAPLNSTPGCDARAMGDFWS